MRAGLVRKMIADKNGKRTTVWVRPNEANHPKPSLSKIEADILKTTKNKVERGVCIGHDGRIVMDRVGEARQIELTEDEIKSIRGAKVFTHNHPGGGCLSPADIGIALRLGIQSMRAIAKGSIMGDVVWVFDKGTMNSGSDAEAFKNAYSLLHLDVKRWFTKKIQDGEMTVEEAESHHYYEVLKQVFEDSDASILLKLRGAKFYWEKL